MKAILHLRHLIDSIVQFYGHCVLSDSIQAEERIKRKKLKTDKLICLLSSPLALPFDTLYTHLLPYSIVTKDTTSQPQTPEEKPPQRQVKKRSPFSFTVPNKEKTKWDQDNGGEGGGGGGVGVGRKHSTLYNPRPYEDLVCAVGHMPRKQT